MDKISPVEKEIIKYVLKEKKKYIYTELKYGYLAKAYMQNKLNGEDIAYVREKYEHDSLGAAYALKSYYNQRHIYSNTIVLKMRPPTSDIYKYDDIKFRNYVKRSVDESSYWAIEVFFVPGDGKWKVFDILNRNDEVELERYLDELCAVNNCKRERLRYDMGMIAPGNVYATNMMLLQELMYYLDKEYCIGKPKCHLQDLSDGGDMTCSDDVITDFDAIAKRCNSTKKEVMESWYVCVEVLNTIMFNELTIIGKMYQLCDEMAALWLIENIFCQEHYIEHYADMKIMYYMLKGGLHEIQRFN